MNIITAPRQGGKTTAIVKWFLADPTERAIVVPHLAMADVVVGIIYREAPYLDHGWVDQRVVTDPRALRGIRAEVAIDELDAFLNRMFSGCPVALATLTPDRELSISHAESQGVRGEVYGGDDDRTYVGCSACDERGLLDLGVGSVTVSQLNAAWFQHLVDAHPEMLA